MAGGDLPCCIGDGKPKLGKCHCKATIWQGQLNAAIEHETTLIIFETEISARHSSTSTRFDECVSILDKRGNLLISLLQVILACNSGPALNDVTYSESLIVAERIAAMDPIIQ